MILNLKKSILFKPVQYVWLSVAMENSYGRYGYGYGNICKIKKRELSNSHHAADVESQTHRV